MGSRPLFSPPSLRLLVFPFLARSHISPVADAARLLAARGVQVTVVATPCNADFVRNSVERYGRSLVELRLIPFPTAEFGLPDGCENLDVLPDHLQANFFGAVAALHGPLHDLLRELRPDGLISDDLFPWTTALAREHRIPRLVFNISGVLAACAQFHLGLHRPHDAISTRTEPLAIPGFPDPVKLTRAELPRVFDHPYFLTETREAELDSYGVIFNSFYDLEPAYVENYREQGSRKLFLIGPVAVAGGEHSSTTEVKDGRDACLQWLDTKEENSVLYLSFGTKGRFSDEQLRELALGLEACGHAFLWVVWAELGEAWMPEGYEERVAGRGLVLRRWVPQTEILAHRAVGGYVIHCGWNSVLEAVCAGVPTATWPIHSEQFVNEKLLVDVLKIGFPVWEGPNSILHEEKVVVPAETVAKAMARLMAGGEEVDAMRRRARALGGMGRRAVAEGGSSYVDLGRLIEELMKCKEERGAVMLQH